MDVNAWTQAISSLGFPIVCCVVMFKYLEKERETHREELDGITKVLSENTRVIGELKNVIEKLTDRREVYLHESDTIQSANNRPIN